MNILVVGSYVLSTNDKDVHYINAMKLCVLYNINPNAKNVRLLEVRDKNYEIKIKQYNDTWIRLTPDMNGEYKDYSKYCVI